MRETLWISLPQQESNALKEVLNLIQNKNLTDLSVNQLIEKIEDEQASHWFEVMRKYNSIPSVNNIESLEMLDRAKSVRRKFRERGYDQLEGRQFQPNQLLGLIILCYSNPNLIGPKLCRALNDNNINNIKKEILENSAYVRKEARIVPWASNLRLLNYALYANDTSVRLPQGVRDRIRESAISKNISLIESNDDLGIGVGLSRDRRFINESSYLLRANSSFANNKLIDGASSAYNAADFNSASALITGGFVLFQIVRSTSAGTVVRNISSDLKKITNCVGNFFSNKESELADQVDQKMVFLPPVAKL